VKLTSTSVVARQRPTMKIVPDGPPSSKIALGWHRISPLTDMPLPLTSES
jgi:hypothetical protein